jgi:NitT/TauT family transport system ATP-binding protein
MANHTHRVSIRELTHVYNDGGQPLAALAGVTLHVPDGQFVAVVGPSGCGKSTLLRIVGGLLKPSMGSARIHGDPPAVAQRRHEVGYVFQDPALLPWRTVASNITLPLELGGLKMSGLLPDVPGLLRLVGLAEFAGYYPHQLSGGMQQRVAIARALAFNPSLLLMDEPFGALDEITRSAMRYELLRLWDGSPGMAGPRTVIFVTHSIAEAVTLADRVIALGPRPGYVRADITIDLPRPRTPAIERSLRFLDYVDQLRDSLKEALLAIG